MRVSFGREMKCTHKTRHEIRKTDKNEEKMTEKKENKNGTERTHTHTREHAHKIFKQQNDLRFHC